MYKTGEWRPLSSLLMNPRTQKQIVGEYGENAASAFLVKKGLRILDRNYRKPWGEIDIVAIKDKVIHFVEVKTVVRDGGLEKADSWEPEDNLHPWKLKRLSRTIETYLLQYFDDNEPDWVFDALLVTISWQNEIRNIEWIEDIEL